VRLIVKETRSHNESNFRGDGVKSCIPNAQGRIYLELKLFKLITMNPKGGELLLSRLKSGENQMEDRMHSNAQIDAQT